VTAFSYPKSRHQRALNPGPYKDYRRYKPALRSEFGEHCVYCRQHDGIKGYAAFGVDHYRPKSLFDWLATEYMNLYYCCNVCNGLKGGYWPAPELESTHFVPSPCEHVMFRHLRYAGPVVEARSQAGEVAIELLRLNDETTVKWREAILTSIGVLRAQESRVTRVLVEIGRRLKANAISPAKAAADGKKAELLLQNTRSALVVYGEPPAV
jgi:hypothetical protein